MGAAAPVPCVVAVGAECLGWLAGCLAERPAGPYSSLPGVLGCSEQGLHHSGHLVFQPWENMLPTRAHTPPQALAECCEAAQHVTAQFKCPFLAGSPLWHHRESAGSRVCGPVPPLCGGHCRACPGWWCSPRRLCCGGSGLRHLHDLGILCTLWNLASSSGNGAHGSCSLGYRRDERG